MSSFLLVLREHRMWACLLRDLMTLSLEDEGVQEL